MKVKQALIIRRIGVEISREYANGCAKSCIEHNLPYQFINGIEFVNCVEAFKLAGVEKSTRYRNNQCNCCCHASHILCWRRIVEIGEPCIILEHDAIIKGDVRTLDIPDMATVSFGNHVSAIDEYEPIGPAQKLTKIARARGCHAYAITPKTANFLLTELKETGVTIGVDRRLMMQPKMDIYLCDPPQAVAWNRKSTQRIEKKADNEKVYSLPQPRIKNEKEMMIPSWINGLKGERNV